MKLTKNILRNMVRAVKMTRPDEIGCDECFEELDRFVEMQLAGKSPEAALPLVKDHLDRCQSCHQEYEALLEAMQNLDG